MVYTCPRINPLLAEGVGVVSSWAVTFDEFHFGYHSAFTVGLLHVCCIVGG